MKTACATPAFYAAFMAVSMAAPAPMPAPIAVINIAAAAIDSAQALEDSSTVLEDRGTADRTGDMTYYNVGMGSCGVDDSGKGNVDYIVAVSPSVMGGNDGACGRKVTINGPNGRVTATVHDECPSCAPGSIDVSEKVFKEVVGDLGVGRSAVTWSFDH